MRGAGTDPVQILADDGENGGHGKTFESQANPATASQLYLIQDLEIWHKIRLIHNKAGGVQLLWIKA